MLGLPVLHDFGVFFTLLLVTWVTGRFGTAFLAGILGSILAVLLGGPVFILGFAASAVVFDLLMSANHHKIRLSTTSLLVAALVTLASAYFAGVVIGVAFMSGGLQWSLTFWGGWHLVGGLLAAAITLPIIATMEKANVRKIKGGHDN